MRTACKAAVFLALSALLAMPALADETPGQKAVREAREATAAECEEVVFSLLSYSRYFDLDAMIGFPVHGFRQNNPATAYREAGSLDGALSDATVWKFQVEGNEVFTMQRGADGQKLVCTRNRLAKLPLVECRPRDFNTILREQLAELLQADF